MSIRQKIISALLVVVALLGGGYTVSNFGGTPGGLPSTVATSSFQAVTAGSVKLLIATSTSCASRIITTQGSVIKLTFSDYSGQTPSGINGHEQAASTTVAYPADEFGCGLVKAFPYTTSVITVTETR